MFPRYYAVQQRQDCGWVTVLVTAERGRAFDHWRAIMADHRRLFPLLAPRVIHASEQLAFEWVAVGNRLS